MNKNNLRYLVLLVFGIFCLSIKNFAFCEEPFQASLNQNDDDSQNSDEVKIIPEDCNKDDQFGRSVDVSGKYALVGASGNDGSAENAGAAYLLYFNGSHWYPIQKLIAMDGDAYDYFGASVAVDSNFAIIGAYGDNVFGNKSGSAYIFTKSGKTWSELSKLIAPDGKALDYFGCSVDISKEYMIVGAYGASDNGSHSGAAYIYKYEDGKVFMHQKLIAGDAEAFDYFGYSVSISGEYAIIGAYGVKYNDKKSGAAYIFKRIGNRWVQLIKLAPSDGFNNDYFGKSVSISGKNAIVGAIGKDDLGNDSGAAYIFRRSGYFWSRQTKIIPENIGENNCFGASVNISDDYAIIGAYGDNMYGKRTGAAYVYQLKRKRWNQIAMFRPKDGSDNDFFGYSVAISGRQVIAGAYGNDAKGEKSGAAYFYGLFSPFGNGGHILK